MIVKNEEGGCMDIRNGYRIRTIARRILLTKHSTSHNATNSTKPNLQSGADGAFGLGADVVGLVG